MLRIGQLTIAALLGGVLSAVLVLSYHEDPVRYAPDPVTARPVAARLVARAAEALPAPVDLRAAARRATPAVVHITARAASRRRQVVKDLFGPREEAAPANGEGSGVIYTSDGYIVTNYHVVRGAKEIVVTTTDRQSFSAELVGNAPGADLAVLRIAATDLPFLEMADSDAAEPGQWVLAVGNPLGLVSTVTAGIISARGRNINLFEEADAIESFLQTDAALNPGNSGGPLVDAQGRLLGINTAIAARNGGFQGYSFAIPINLVRRIADDIIQFGAYQRVYLGVEISTLTPADVARLQPGQTVGVVIDAVFTDGSAEAAGLRVGDVIIAIAGRPIRDLPELTELIGRANVGETLDFRIIRQGKTLTLPVTMQ